MERWVRENWIFCIVALVLCVAKIGMMNTGFFWDSVSLISTPAHYLYENGIQNIFFPPEINITMATVPQLYTAFVWLLFGRVLWVTHLAYLLVVLTFSYQLYLLCKRFVAAEFLPYVYLFVLFDAVVFTQILLLSPDLFLLTFGVWSLNNLYGNKRWQLALSLLLLAATSARGILLAGVLMMFNFVLLWRENCSLKIALKKSWLQYLPTAIFMAVIIFAQKINSGFWVVNTQEASPWSEHWHFVDVQHFVRNIALVAFRYIENGRLFVCAVFVAMVIRFRKKLAFDKSLWLLLSIFLLIMFAATLPFYNPIGARYFAFSFIVFALIVADVLIKNLSARWAKTWLVAMTVVLLSSNFVIYPERMAQCWDGTLAHIPYYELREQVIDYFSANSIEKEAVGVSFPMECSLKQTDLADDNQRFPCIDFEKNQFVVYSNVFNLDDATIDQIKQYPCVKQFRKNGVFMDIYQIR